MNEIYPLFNLSWMFVSRSGTKALFFTGNYSYMNFRTLDHWFFGVDAAHYIKANIQLTFQAMTAVKGISGFVFSVNEIQLLTGVKIGF